MKIYIANLDEKIIDNQLFEAFSEYGTVASARVILDKNTWKSRGFGFIDMPNDKEALYAIETLDGGKWKGKIIVVKKADNQ